MMPAVDVRRVLVPLDVSPALRLRAPHAAVLSLGGETMGTTWSVQAVAPRADARSLRSAIEHVLDGVIAEMSTWVADSHISRFNRASPGTWHLLPRDFAEVLRFGLRLAADTDGAYDPTIGALVDLWGFGPRGRSEPIPNEEAIASARSQCGWRRVTLDLAGRALQPGGIRLDLASIAKGFAVDKVSAGLISRGIVDHLVEIGGELVGSGTKPDGSPWWVALEEARHGEARGRETIVALHDLAIATSGDSQRFVEVGERRLSHTLDPRTGTPVSERLAAVTVLHRRCVCADALATALLVLGPEAACKFAVERNLAARFLLRRGAESEERMTPAMAAMLG
jgi:FAD:protein FMN transferase